MNKPSFNALSDRTALVVDDDPDMCWVLKTTLELFDYSAAIAENGKQALRLSATRPFPIAFIDARLPDVDGLQLATVMHSKHKDLRIIIISGFYSEAQDSPHSQIAAKVLWKTGCSASIAAKRSTSGASC